MGNTLWSMLNNKSKSKKSSYELAKKTNIPEEKVKEILNGDREVPSDRVDTLVSAIKEDNKLEKTLNIESIKRWINETDLKALRMSFNYETQGELAKELGVHTSVISRLERKITNQSSDALLMRYYDFLTDELNKKVVKPTGTYDQSSRKKENTALSADVDTEELAEWYNNFDFKVWLEENKLTAKDFALKLGYKPSSVSLIYALVNHAVDTEGRGSVVILRAYLYITGKVEKFNNTKEIEPKVEEPQISLDTEEPTENYVKVEEPVEFKPSTITSTTYSVPVDSVVSIKMDSPEPEKITMYKYQYDDLIENSRYLSERVELLETQVERYEKLIDLIERK